MKNKSLFIFSFKFIAFFSVFAVIAFVLFIPYAPDEGNDSKYIFALNELKQEKENFDIAIFGNSYCFTAYDPTILWNQLGLNAIHVSSSAQRLLTSLVVAKKVISEYRFKYIVFDVSDASVINPNPIEKKIWYYQTLGFQEIPFSMDKFFYVSNFYPNDLYPEYYVSALSKNMGRFFRLNKRSDYVERDSQKDFVTNGAANLFGYNGYIAMNHNSISKKNFLNAINEKPGSRLPTDSLWTKELKGLMHDVISISKENNTQIIFVNSLKLKKRAFKDEYLDSIVKNNSNVNFINLNEDRGEYFLNENSFYNFTHLNYLGSYMVTHRLVDSMSNWYSLDKRHNRNYKMELLNLKDVFYNLEEDQDKFIKLEFDSIPKILNDHQLVIAIFPKDTSLLSDYSKKKKWKSDNYYIKHPADISLNLGKSKVIIKKFSTNITEESLDHILIFFYKSKDTLKLPRITIDNDD